MRQDFLSASHTLACQDRDFAEWHGGIAGYGVWCILVEDAAWLEYVTAGQAHVASYTLPDYQRQPHITLAPCGLLDEQHFSDQLLARQIDVLTAASLGPFSLQLSPGVDSFTTAPYLPVDDPRQSLPRIRRLLTAIVPEDHAPAGYQPHITLGLYGQAWPTGQLVAHLATFLLPPPNPLTIRELCLCSYQTSRIQGPLTVRHRFLLR